MENSLVIHSKNPTVLFEDSAARDYIRASKSEATQRAYASDFRDFSAWCLENNRSPLPASVDTVVIYLAARAEKLKPSSLTRRVAAIRFAHRAAGFPSPTGEEPVKAVMGGIRRTKGVAPLRKAPATAQIIKNATDDLEGLKGLRDRALLILGFAAALRRSELVALDVSDIEETDEGLLLHIRRSKTDQEGAGEIVSVPHGARLKPVAALKAWLTAANITSGPIFRPVRKGGTVMPARLNDRSVAKIVKDRVEAAGYDALTFSGHSLRAGFVTSALANGADILRVMDVTRHREISTLKAYDRRAKAFRDHAGQSFL